jgi:class 3 adenylate cyclase/tetratricopeptide (TPR) repeat protein
LLTEEMMRLGGEAAAAEGPAPSAPAELSPEEHDELIDAFIRQFEEHQVYVPREWSERLRRLAAEAETSRRQAMVFFVDLRGYTALSRKLNERQMDELLKWFYGLCSSRVERHGGFVIQLLGDAVFAAFGAPWAFERDAESGLRALLEIREEVRRRGSFEGHELSIRAGADCGTVNVRLTRVHHQTRLDLFGSTVNLAARLQAAAETFEILVSDTLADQVRGVFEMEPRAEFEPKNYGRTVRPEALLEHRGAAAERRRQDLEFVGREEELAALAAHAEEAAGGGYVALRLTGEAGVGKTRLVQEADGRLDSARIRTLSIDCDPHYRYSLLQAMRDLVRLLAADPEGPNAAAGLDGRAQLDALVGRYRQLAPELIPSLGCVLGVEPYDRELRSLPGRVLRAQIVAALAGLIEAAAAERPLLLFMDNMQWVDRLTWEVVERLDARRMPGLMLLVTARPVLPTEMTQGSDFFDVANTIRQAGWPELALGPLAEPQLRRLLEQILDIETLHPMVRQRLLGETEGIPLYLIEMARRVAGEGSLPLVEQLRNDYPGQATPHIPPAVVEIMQARIDKLHAQRRTILQCGAVVGRRFSDSMIRIFEAIFPQLLAELLALKGINMLRMEPLPEDLEYRFNPTILRDVAYHMMTAEQQSQLHRRVAELVEHRFGDRLDSLAFELAVHWMRAGDQQRSRRYLRRAARRALAQGAAHEAYELVSQAIASFDDVGLPALGDLPSRQSLEIQQQGLIEGLGGQAVRMLGEYEQSSRHYNRLLSIARAIDNERWLHEALCGLAINEMERGRLGEADALLSEIPEQAGGKPHYPQAWIVRGVVRLRSGRLDEALSDFRTIAEQVEEESSVIADAWNNVGLVHWQSGRLDEARAAFDRALEVWRRIGQPFGEVATQSNLGIIAEKQSRLADARRCYEAALARAESLGYMHGISAIQANLANLAILRQDWTAAREHSARALQAARMIEHRNSETIALENLGLAQAGEGLIDLAMETLRNAELFGEAMGDATRRDSARLAQAWVLLSGGEASGIRGKLAFPEGELSPDLRPWRETIGLALDAVERGGLRPDFKPREWLAADPAETLEDHLRRIDALIMLERRGLLDDPSLDLHAERSRRLAGVG